MSEQSVINLLLMDRSPSDGDRILQILRETGYTVQETRADQEKQLHDIIEYRPVDLIMIRSGEGLPSLTQVRTQVTAAGQNIPIIAIVDDIAQQHPVDLLHAGADNFFELKEPEHLRLVVAKELHHFRLQQQVRSQEIRLEEADSRSRAFLDNSRDAIAYIHEGAHIYANPAYRTLFGYASEEEITGTPLMDLIESGDRDKLKRLLRHITKAGKPLDPVELIGVNRDQQKFPIFMRCVPMRMDGEPCLQILIQNPSQQQDFERKLTEIAQYDELTGLYNRKFFIQRVNKVCTRRTHAKGALLYILLTDYRGISERMGLEAIEHLLTELGGLLRETISDQDIAAHFSDAVFTVYTPESSSRNAVQLGERLCDAIRNYDTHVAEKLVNTSCSIGVALVQDSHKNATQVLFHADRACETARQMGGNQVQLYEPPSTTTGLVREEEQRYLGQIKSAVVEERLHLLYQPIASFQGEATERYKAYLRIVDENQRALSLNVLAPVAENHNLMGQLDKWVIARCLEMLSEQRQTGKTVPILFIRISNNSLADDGFYEWLQQRLEENELAGDRLVIEVPEESAEKYFKETRMLRDRLGQKRCGFALSHYGGKMNSERILHHLTPNYIKLDIALIEQLAKARDKASQEAMQVITTKAQEIKAQIIAADVASAHQMASIWQFDVTLVQGDMVQEASPRLDFDFQQFIA